MTGSSYLFSSGILYCKVEMTTAHLAQSHREDTMLPRLWLTKTEANAIQLFLLMVLSLSMVLFT